KALVALDRQALAAGGEYRVEELGRTGDRHRLALSVGRDFLGRVLAFAGAESRLQFGLRALLERAQSRRTGVSGGLLVRERIELARLGGDAETRLDDVGVGHAAPQPLQQVP